MAASPRIRVLPAELAEQIAAGEVVERPASVVKELVENALDAGATRVDVTLEAGGRRLIRIVDDGCGMTAEEARLAIKRHATSKLTCADDLWRLDTFGFRGEALPSIASVSRFGLSTKVRGGVAGFRLSLEGGRETEAREVGMPDGTQIEVRDLFFNVPARLKFLKTEATETANVSEALLRLSLANPAVHFRLRSNDRVALDLPPNRDRGERVRAALGRRGAGALHEALGEENGVHVHAFVAAPEEATTTPRNTFLFVGRRFVRDRSLTSALGLAYGELLEKGRYPLAALFLEIPGEEVDVNVHPQKLEVRFSNAQEVYAAVRHVVGAAIARAPWLRAAPGRAFSLSPSAFARPGLDPVAETERRAEAAWAGARPAGAGPGGGGQAGFRPAPGFVHERNGAWGGGSSAATRAAEADVVPGRLPGPTGLVPDATGAGQGFFSTLTYLGQLDRTYLVCESAGELVLVDQHAAHERVAFERLRSAYRGRSVSRQQLLFPMEIPVDDAALAVAQSEAGAAALGELGFEVDAFGGRRLVLRAVPRLLESADPKPLLLDLLARLGEGDNGGRLADEALDHIFATMACHSVRRAGDVLPREEVVSLLAQLDTVDLRSHCPHGRPVLVRIPVTELERRFGRT